MNQFAVLSSTPHLSNSPYDVWRRAERLFTARDYLGAAATLEELLDDPAVDERDLSQVRELLARSYYHSARLGRAASTARDALEKDPGNDYLVLLLGRSLERSGHADEAAPYLRMAAATATA